MRNSIRNLMDRLGRRFAVVIGSPFPIYFLVGVLAANLISDGISSLVEQLFGVSMQQIGWIKIIGGGAILLLTLIAFSLSDIGRWLSRLAKSHEASVVVENLPPPRKGLVVLVSMGHFVPADAAMKYHFNDGNGNHLQYCWLLVGPGEGELSSNANANRLKERYEALGVEVIPVSLNDADDPGEVFLAMQDIIKEAQKKYGLYPRDLVADFTGGTKCMTTGMVLACVDQNLAVQFMKPDKYTSDGRVSPDAHSFPRLVDIDFYSPRRQETEMK